MSARPLALPTVAEVQRRLRALTRRPGVERLLLAQDQGDPIEALRVPREPVATRLRLLITAGVHGDEACGVTAALRVSAVARRGGRRWEGVDLTAVPLLAPGALRLGRRRLPGGQDLNRCFVDDREDLAAVRALHALLRRQRFDLALDLHRGGVRRNGFWVVQHGAREAMERAVRRLGTRWPILSGDTRPYRMVAPGVAESGRAATLKNHLARRGVPRTATAEAPGSLPPAQQVRGLVALVTAIVDEVLREPV